MLRPDDAMSPNRTQNQPNGLTFLDDVVPAIASLLRIISLWEAKIWNHRSRSSLCQLTLPMYDQFQWLSCWLQSSVVALVPVQDQKHS